MTKMSKGSRFFLVVFATIAVGVPAGAAGAQEQAATVAEGPTVVEINCIEQTRYIYDGFDRYAAGTEAFCVAIMSDGTTRSFTAGPLVQI